MSTSGWEYVPCDLCGSRNSEILFEKEGFKHVRCHSCKLVYVNPRPANHLESQKVSGTGSMGDEELSRGQRRRVRREVNRLIDFRRTNRIIEIGPGKGWFLEEASRLGWETWAVEINQDALKSLQQRGVTRVTAESAESFQAPEGCADVVRMWDVIEHLASPRQALLRAHSALRPGGLLCLATTNIASLSFRINGPEWVYVNGADHIYLFEPHTISRMLKSTGFSKVEIRTKSFNLRRKLYHPEKHLDPLHPMLLPFRKIIDELIRFTSYGHQMIVNAQKTMLDK